MRRRLCGADEMARILFVEDDGMLRRAVSRVLRRAGYAVFSAGTLSAARAALRHAGIPDLILSDVVLNGETGIELVREVRARDLDVPVIFMTGHPELATAIHAVELGAFRYLTKPVSTALLLRTVAEAIQARGLLHARQLLKRTSADEQLFQRALDEMWLAYQPIVAARTRQLYAYEALFRTHAEGVHIGHVLAAAERLGALHTLGAAVRERAAEAVAEARDVHFFVNLHSEDLLDPDLYDPVAPLSFYAERVVLELTERATLSTVADLRDRIARLRAMRYRIAIDDLGAGYAGLSYFASVHPDVFKIDMSLVRGIDDDPVKQHVVMNLAELAENLGISVVAEGVETLEERDLLVELGAHYLQGYVLARPGPAFPVVVWL